MACKRGFYIFGESWYSKDVRKEHQEEVTFGNYYKDGGCEFELAATWQQLGSSSGLVLQINVFEDAFKAFSKFSDVFEALAKIPTTRSSLNVKEFCSLLLKMGFEDMTSRVRPGSKKPAVCPNCHREIEE